MNNYVAHYNETAEYDGLGLYWRKVTYNEVLAVKPSTLRMILKALMVEKAKLNLYMMELLYRFCYSFPCSKL